MLIDLKIQAIRMENDIIKRFLRIFARHPDFLVNPSARIDTVVSHADRCVQIRLRHAIAAALLAPTIPSYVEGVTSQLTVCVMILLIRAHPTNVITIGPFREQQRSSPGHAKCSAGRSR